MTQINDLDSALFQCPPTKLEILLGWFTTHYVLGIVILLFVGWFLIIVAGIIHNLLMLPSRRKNNG